VLNKQMKRIENMKNTLAEKSVLMRFSAGLPGSSRKDARTTREIQSEKKLSADSGKYVKNLWPEDALKAVKQKQGEARAYHDKVTLPFGCKSDDDGVDAISGVGILPAALIAEYGDKMRQFKGQFDNLVETTFLADPRKWVDWAMNAHNGTFDAKNYPGCQVDASGVVQFDAEQFRTAMRKRFYLRTEPLPVPNASHFEESIRLMLGQDAESVDLRLADAEAEARREVLRRLIEPVRAMATKLAEQPKDGKESPIFRDSLVENLKDIAALAPALNITGDKDIDAMAKQVGALAQVDAEALRKSDETRKCTAEDAQALLKKLEGYKF